jgi:hypothetical protein
MCTGNSQLNSLSGTVQTAPEKYHLCEKPEQQHLSAFPENIYNSKRISPTSYMNGLPVTVQEQILEVRGKSAKEISAKKDIHWEL